MNSLRHFRKCVRPDLRVLGLIATISVFLGVVFDYLRTEPLGAHYHSKAERLEDSVSALHEVAKERLTRRQVSLNDDVSLDDFRAFALEGRGIVVDARPEIFYRLGHVPGAVSLPRDDFESCYRRLRSVLTNRNTPLVVYCSSASCSDGELVRAALIALGHEQVAVFRAGWVGWTQAGLPEVRSE